MEILADSRVIRNRTLLLIGTGIFCAFLILFIVIGVLANKSNQVEYRDSPTGTQETGEAAVSGSRVVSRSSGSCQKCRKNPTSMNPNLEYAKCILEHYPLVDG